MTKFETETNERPNDSDASGGSLSCYIDCSFHSMDREIYHIKHNQGKQHIFNLLASYVHEELDDSADEVATYGKLCQDGDANFGPEDNGVIDLDMMGEVSFSKF
jgi:hypothetical protein